MLLSGDRLVLCDTWPRQAGVGAVLSFCCAVSTNWSNDLNRLRECMPNLCLWLSCFACLLFGYGDCHTAVEEHEEDADDGKDHEDHQGSMPKFDQQMNVILIA